MWFYVSTLILQAPVKIAVIFKQLRALIESVLKQKLENPKMPLEGNFIISIIAMNMLCNTCAL